VSEDREPVSEDAVKRIRQIFGPVLAAKIEAWTLDVPYPSSTLEMLVLHFDWGASHMFTVLHYVGLMIDVLGPRPLDDEERALAVSAIVAKVNELIADEAEKLF
jgi:hypothetical protein